MWYLLQIIVFCYVLHTYHTEIAPEVSVGTLMFFSGCVVYAITWLVTRILDFFHYRLLLLFKHWILRRVR